MQASEEVTAEAVVHPVVVGAEEAEDLLSVEAAEGVPEETIEEEAVEARDSTEEETNLLSARENQTSKGEQVLS